jgi:deoxyinosine 3'endonuclease (endonuclease V)
MEVPVEAFDNEQLLERWRATQDELKSKLLVDDHVIWKTESGALAFERVAGVDISFVKNDTSTACAGLVVMALPDLRVVYERFEMVSLTQPYIPGFLAFREVEFLVSLLKRLKETQPEQYPDCVLVDGNVLCSSQTQLMLDTLAIGNGMLHPRGFGLACHLGVLLDIPTIGIGKNFLQIDGMTAKDVKAEFLKTCKDLGDSCPLIGESKTCWGVALKPAKDVTKAVYISIGHKLALSSCVQIVMALSKFRLPEPIRFADQRSRQFLREKGFNAAE